MSLQERIRLDSGATVVCHPYRTAMVRDRIMTFPRNELDYLEELLAERAGVNRDNHVVYEVTSHDGSVIYIFCHDFRIYFGFKLVKERW